MPFKGTDLLLAAAWSMATSMSPLHEAFTLAAAFVSLGVLAKLAARRENDRTPKINELGIPTTVSLMTLSKIFADIFAAGSPSHELLTAAAIGLPALLLFVVWERYVSWYDAPGSPPRRKFWWGIVIPDILAIAVLFLYYLLRYGGLSA